MTFSATLPSAALTAKAASGLALALLAVGGASAATIAGTASSARSNVAAAAANSSHSSSTAAGTTADGTSTAFGQQVKAKVQSGLRGTALAAWITANNPGDAHSDAAGANANGQAPASTPVGSSANHPTGAPASHPGR